MKMKIRSLARLFHDKQFCEFCQLLLISLLSLHFFPAVSMPPHLRASRQSRRCRKNSQKEQTRLSFKSILFSRWSLADFWCFLLLRFFHAFTSFAAKYHVDANKWDILRDKARRSKLFQNIRVFFTFLLQEKSQLKSPSLSVASLIEVDRTRKLSSVLLFFTLN